MALVITAFLTITAAQASAEIIVNHAGTGSGVITSNPTGIECSNVGGAAGPNCSESFPTFTPSFEPNPVELTASPNSDSYLVDWSGDDPLAELLGGSSCNANSETSCRAFDPKLFSELFGGPSDTHITATFDLLPNPPAVATAGISPGAESWLRTLEGTVDPEEFKVSGCRFEYGTTTEYGTVTPCVEPDASELDETSTPEPVRAETEPLEPNTTYHYRLVASNLGGTSHGEDRTFTTGPAQSGTCPNEARREEQGVKALRLPDCMALEMVSPPQKSGFQARFPIVSADGGRVSFFSQAALGEDPTVGATGGAMYLAGRGDSGWSSEITVPRLEPPLFAFWASQDSLSFTPDLSRWFGFGATTQGWQRGIGRAYEAGLGGFFRPMSEPLVPRSIVDAHPYVAISQLFQGASADHSHLYLKPKFNATYLPGDPPFSNAAGAEPANVYLARSGTGGEPAPLDLLQRDRDAKVWGGNCGARLGGIGEVPNGSPPNGERNQGAVSADGSRTYFSARASQPQDGDCEVVNKLRILQRIETPTGPLISPLFASECSRPNSDECSSADGDDLYQGASLDQSKVYFTTNRQLANSDIDGSGEECSVQQAVVGCDLYLYDSARPAGERLVQVSAGEELGPSVHEAGREANVFNGITAISADGSHVYFVATGVLTEDENPAGDSAQVGEPNLYMWDAEGEETTFLGTLARALSESDLGDAIFTNSGKGLWGGQGTWKNNAYPVPILSPSEQAGERGEEGGDGHILVFESKAELTASDGDGRRLDAYRYDAEAETLQCLSCAPGSSGAEPDEAPFDVRDRSEERLLGTDFAENHRWVSEDGQEVTFMTPQRLLPGDVNGAEDFYLWRQGALVRLPGKPYVSTVKDPGSFLSHDGSTVAFTTVTPLLPQDGDLSPDVYVARRDGGFPIPLAPEPCEPGSPDPSKRCQSPITPPLAPQAGSEAARPGNVRPDVCGRLARRAQSLSKRARRGRANARLFAHRGKGRRAQALRRRASRLGKAAKANSNRAKRCREGRQGRRANTNRRTAK